MTDPHDPAPDRATFLPVMLGGILGLFCLAVLVMLTGGLLFYVVLIVAFLGGMGCLHYLLWGKLLAERTAGESEEQQLLDRARAEDHPE